MKSDEIPFGSIARNYALLFSFMIAATYWISHSYPEGGKGRHAQIDRDTVRMTVDSQPIEDMILREGYTPLSDRSRR